MKLPDARKVNNAERSILNRILELPFPGSETIAEQLRNFLVVPIDDNGSLDFLIEDGPKARVHNSVPVEAEAEDIDGTTIHLLLHVIEGITRGLEVYKDDSSRVIRMPEPSEFRIFSPP
jgi:hypothetical protein